MINSLVPHATAILALADGTVFHGVSIGAPVCNVGEVVFNTALTGYQEIISDPSYAQQMVTLTYPHIGNVGVNAQDMESDRAWASGLIIRDYSQIVSNWRAEKDLSTFLQEQGIPAIANIDTRELTRILRDKGAQNACLMAGDVDEKKALQLARKFSGLAGLDLAKTVSTQEVYEWKEGSSPLQQHLAKPGKKIYTVVVYDFGVKRQILRWLVDHGCRVIVVPAQTSVETVMSYRPHGVVLSNGPGDPGACDYAIFNTRQLLEKNVPIFGICLGFQILGLACGGKTIKMKFGHHGSNHPVQNLENKHVMITSQNHGFTVDDDSLPAVLKVTHRSLFDNTMQGIRHVEKKALAMQGHPEAGPGPHDALEFFSEFIQLMDT